MFDPDAESVVLEIARGFFGITSEEMMKIGDAAKKALFESGVESQEAAVARLKATLDEMPREHALIAGIFISGLIRCNLAEQCMRAMAEEGAESCGCGCSCECDCEDHEEGSEPK